jgi:hypothetical protein
MKDGKGIVIGFVVGIAVAGGAILLLRDEPAVAGTVDAARIGELDAQIQRLEQSVSRLTALTLAANPGVAETTREAGAAVQPPVPVDPEREKSEPKALVTATAMVDQGLQTGQWTRAQQRELDLVAADLQGDEYMRLMARIAAAVNRDELQVELP